MDKITSGGGKYMSGVDRDGTHERSSAGKSMQGLVSKTFKRPCLLMRKKCSLNPSFSTLKRSLLLIGFVLLLFLGAKAASSNSKGFHRNLDSFFCTVDQDGNGEIEQGEATEFLRSLDAQMAIEDEAGTKEGMSDLLASSHFDFNFSYGGNTISAEELLDHLSNMMTANHVVDWVTHGLELPQYADAFRKNAINGMDFPALIANDSQALAEDLGIRSMLHRTKITHALVRQVFGIGTMPGPVRMLQCAPASYGGIHLSWEAPNNRGVPPLHKYLIERWSKTLSTWIDVAATRETAFLDKNAVKLGKNYTYRVQTWGGHGPSDWVKVDGCRADLLSSASDVDTEEFSVKQLPRQVMENAESESLSSRDTKPFNEEDSGMWTWINSGLILVLAICSRHTFFFDVSLAAWVLLKNHLWQALRQGVDSPYLWVRTGARSITMACESWTYMQHKVWALSRLGVKSPMGVKRPSLKSLSEPCINSPYVFEEDSGTGVESLAVRSLSADSLLESNCHLLSSLGKSRGSSPSSSEPERYLEEEVEKASLLLPPTPPREVEKPTLPAKKSKNRCNHEGCKVRFDRWHYFQDWWMKLNKHYCRECQSVYCVKHTRISPHGPRGQCGLDSNCYCFNCFAILPSESKRRLEEINRLRVGPSVTSDSTSTSTSTSMSSSASRGSLKEKVSNLSNSSLFCGAGLPPSLSDTMEPFLDDNGLLDFREVVGARPVGVSKAASDSGMPDQPNERPVLETGISTPSRGRHRRQRSCS